MKYGMPIALSGLGPLGCLGLLGLSPVLFRKKQGEVDFDERDVLIHRKATVVAYSIFWLFFTSACMIPWFLVGPKNSIPSSSLPLMLGAGGITLVLSQSLAILILYGKGEKS